MMVIERRGEGHSKNIQRHEAASHPGAHLDLLTLFPGSQNFIHL